MGGDKFRPLRVIKNMTKKILEIAGTAVLAAILAIAGVAILNAIHQGSARLGFAANMNSINLVPNTTVGGDTYGLAVNGLSLFDTSGYLHLGSSSQYSQVDFIATASSTLMNGTTTAIVLSPIFPLNSTTSFETSTVFTITSAGTAQGFAVGDPCIVFSNTTGTSQILIGCQLTGVVTSSASATVTYANVNVTATSTIPTSTILRYEIHHLAF